MWVCSSCVTALGCPNRETHPSMRSDLLRLGWRQPWGLKGQFESELLTLIMASSSASSSAWQTDLIKRCWWGHQHRWAPEMCLTVCCVSTGRRWWNDSEADPPLYSKQAMLSTDSILERGGRRKGSRNLGGIAGSVDSETKKRKRNIYSCFVQDSHKEF